MAYSHCIGLSFSQGWGEGVPESPTIVSLRAFRVWGLGFGVGLHPKP